jgi:hypothetical protein
LKGADHEATTEDGLVLSLFRCQFAMLPVNWPSGIFGLNVLTVNGPSGIAAGLIQRIAGARLARELSEEMIRLQFCIALK